VLGPCVVENVDKGDIDDETPCEENCENDAGDEGKCDDGENVEYS